MHNLTINKDDKQLQERVSQFKGLVRSEVEDIQTTLAKFEQYEPITDHYFHAGMYCRKVFRVAGALVVGKIHKKDHFYVCVSGQLIVWNENGATLLNPGDVILSKAGSKRVVYAVKDSIGMTMHICSASTVEEAERMLVEDDENSMYDVGNKVKVPTLEEINFTVALIKE